MPFCQQKVDASRRMPFVTDAGLFRDRPSPDNTHILNIKPACRRSSERFFDHLPGGRVCACSTGMMTETLSALSTAPVSFAGGKAGGKPETMVPPLHSAKAVRGLVIEFFFTSFIHIARCRTCCCPVCCVVVAVGAVAREYAGAECRLSAVGLRCLRSRSSE